MHFTAQHTLISYHQPSKIRWDGKKIPMVFNPWPAKEVFSPANVLDELHKPLNPFHA